MIWPIPIGNLFLKQIIMSNSALIKTVQESFLQEGREQIRTGMEVEVHQIIKEGSKERIQKFKGLVIKTAGKSA
jgi:ribosomal protein L19